MQIAATQADVTSLTADVLVLGIFADGPRSGWFAQVDERTGGALGRLIESQEIRGKLGEVTPVLGLGGLTVGQVIVVGQGKSDSFGPQAAYRAAGASSKHLAARPRATVVFALDRLSDRPLVQAAVCGATVGCQGQDLYRQEKKRHPFGRMEWIGVEESALQEAEVLADAVNLTRRLVNEPPQDMYPESFAAQAQAVAGSLGLECEIWDQARLEQERCGSLLAVAKGSSRPPRLVILRHRGGAPDQPPLALVGKGVTFDSGGLSLKPSDSMLTMKCDMAGAATVLGAMAAIARLRLPCHVIGLMGLVENMPGPGAMKLGDVLHARNGKTIEVHNTDAEGRLVLADVLDVALSRGAERIVDLATLTGSCVVALGTDVAGLMTNDDLWGEQVRAAAGACGELLWPMPMFPDYADHIRSEVADIKNVGDGRWGGSITAAKFLEEFVGGKPWVHLDIAGPAFLDKPRPWSDGGGTGIFVRTLCELARRHGAG